MNRYFIIGLLITVIVWVLYNTLTKPKQIHNLQTIEQVNDNGTIMTIYKSGGIMGMVFRLEVYDDYTYKMFSHDKLVYQDKLDANQINSVNYFIKNGSSFKELSQKLGGCDFLHHVIVINGQTISMDSLDEPTRHEEIKTNCNQLDKLMDWSRDKKDIEMDWTNNH